MAACGPLNSSDRFRAMSFRSGLTQPDPLRSDDLLQSGQTVESRFRDLEPHKAAVSDLTQSASFRRSPSAAERQCRPNCGRSIRHEMGPLPDPKTARFLAAPVCWQAATKTEGLEWYAPFRSARGFLDTGGLEPFVSLPVEVDTKEPTPGEEKSGALQHARKRYDMGLDV